MNYYETLGVSRNSEPDRIDAAYRALMKVYHPDRWQGDKADSEAHAKSINEAYATLRDRDRRRAYDRSLRWDGPAPSKRRPLAAKGTAKAASRHPASPRPIARARRARPRPVSPSWIGSSRALRAVAISAVIGLTGAVALATRGFDVAQLGSGDPLMLAPVPASLLHGGRRQMFCVSNNTGNAIEYTLYWGGTTGRRYTLEPGNYMIHSSAFTAAPVVAFLDNAASEVARKVVDSTVTREQEAACRPNYSFENKALEEFEQPGRNRLGLFRDGAGELFPQPPVDAEVVADDPAGTPALAATSG